jgi:lipoprotein NlpD
MSTVAARLFALVAVAALLAGCSHSRVVKREGSASAPQRSAAARAPARGGDYVVRGGDTLYGIAFRHGLDYREVARWNRIPAPYTIYPGQRLRLSEERVASRPRNTSRGSVTGMPTPVPAPTPVTRPGAAAVASGPAGPAPVTPLPPETRPANGTAPVARPTVPASSTPVVVPGAPVVPAAVSAGGWRWPTQGQLIGRFAAGDPKRQGIDIAGTAGQPVVAAADGVVVYSGAGLVGYGELIIVKHSDEWLSAYAHARKRLVTEGTAVRAGEAIAELGRTGTSRDMLHFEVRRNGKPVDPLTVLPPQ